MQVNIIIVFAQDRSRVLMCLRRKDPYKGLLNFVGGKVKAGEDHLEAAYRELWEETAISKEQIRLTHVMDLRYPLADEFLEVYTGTLPEDVQVHGEENELLWVDVGEDFSDISRFAGKGNIYHIMRYLEALEEKGT
ncbi:MAG: NUDIX domain-containing protein [Candidatus Limiplasma sp.]|nr:NUDIX domain-containing protein [Candidatus Limiplasma sp.]